jgi:hypothetical protein
MENSRAALAACETPSPPSNAVDSNAELKAEIMICDCCGHEFFGDPNGARLCNRNDCVAAFVKMHVDRTVRALGPSSAAPDADEGADIAALEAQLMEKRRELSRRTGASQGLAPPGSA